MKINLYIRGGVPSSEHIMYRVTQAGLGNKVYFLDGTIKGFKDYCDKVVVDVDNKAIEKWAYQQRIPVEYFEGFEKEVKKIEDEVMKDGDETEEKTDEQSEEKKEEVVPKVKEVPEKIEVGVYKNTETGEEFERKKGPNIAKAFKEAIQDYGWDKFEKVQ